MHNQAVCLQLVHFYMYVIHQPRRRLFHPQKRVWVVKSKSKNEQKDPILFTIQHLI